MSGPAGKLCNLFSAALHTSTSAPLLIYSKCAVNSGRMGPEQWAWGVSRNRKPDQPKGQGKVRLTLAASLPELLQSQLSWLSHTGKDTAKLCSLLRSISSGDSGDQGSPRTLGPGWGGCWTREAANLSHVWEPSEKSRSLSTATAP